MPERKAIAMPGTRRGAKRLQEMIRVDHAGEYGAVTIYQGQRAVFSRIRSKARITSQLKVMEDDEQHHLETFDTLIAERDVRPTLMAPLWNVAGHALGVATALMGEKAAHACTEAVEDVIEQHYADQIAELDNMDEPEFQATIVQFRDEEIAHRDLAIDEGAKDAPGYPILSALIGAGCRTAIAISQKI